MGTFADGTPWDPDEAQLRRISGDTWMLSQQMKMAYEEDRMMCAECTCTVDLPLAYRCYYCGKWYCFDCAADHFGQTREEFMYEDSEANDE